MSPWVELPDAELQSAAEGEGPSIDEDAEAPPVTLPDLTDPSDWERLQKCVDDWYAGRIPCTIEAPAPRPCAVDRLEAAGYKLRAVGNVPMFINSSTRIRVCIGGGIDHYMASALGGVDARGDESPGLNAALESLLSKPVGAVTVAQILGVA
jgi:hypothetical protein